ncbi:MAG: HNH endonuclease signature motif containing protein [Prevotella sp.]|nr:HNH endonuclease signature motif containing protein [Prevotella sp.]MDY3786194.1 HNH endonuclease signature motif containing protein [Prevotella sp.]MDY4442198.1 HNH endonuclease signature motif containing protein [Prevotella sp.]MDY4665844.1 HNH endonuclease signature motif containing protein [Prevotella sp.]
MCERCREEGRLAPATEVHHIRPVEEGLTLREKEQLMFDPHNLRALCHECHVKTHTEMGRCGKKQAKERAEAHLLRFKERFMGQ